MIERANHRRARLLAAAAIGVALNAQGMAQAATQDRPGRGEMGTRALEAHRCERGEDKEVFVLGVPDDFAGGNDEPGKKRAALASNPGLAPQTAGHYDQEVTNQPFHDYFELPANVSSGIFVTSLKSVGEQYENDNLVIGDTSNYNSSTPLDQRHTAGWRINQLAASGWDKMGDVYRGSLADMELLSSGNGGPYASVLELVQSGSGQTFLDVYIQDDTAVDYIGLAVCLSDDVVTGGDSGKKGLTFKHLNHDPVSGVARVGCGSEPDRCDPYEGDTSCDSPQPLLCFYDMDAPAPGSLPAGNQYNRWAGGVIATTPEVAASNFATLADADAHCESEFGEGWRTASFHEGQHWNFRAYGNVGDPTKRVWVDIDTQQNGTCWAQ